MQNPFYNFQFIPITTIFSWAMDPNMSLQKNKTTIFQCLFLTPKILKEIVKQIKKALEAKEHLEADLFLVQKNNEMLKSLIKKIEKKICVIIGDSQDHERSFSSLEEESCKLDSKEYTFFLNALQFIVGGKIIEDEEKKVFELGIQKNQTVQINFSVQMGFEDRNNRAEESRMDLNPFFWCAEHKEKTTHYCLTCKRLICSLDIVPLKKLSDSKHDSEGCKGHDVVTLLDFQTILEEKLSKTIEEITKIKGELKQNSDVLANEASGLVEKIKKNDGKLKTLDDFAGKFTKVLKMTQDEHETLSPVTLSPKPFHVFFSKIEEMMKLSQKFEEFSSYFKVESNEKLDAKLEIDKEAKKMKQEYEAKMKAEIEKLQSNYKKKEEELDHKKQKEKENFELIKREELAKFEKMRKEMEKANYLELTRMMNMKTQVETEQKQMIQELEREIIEILDSHILTYAWKKTLDRFVKLTLGSRRRMNLLYRATRDGWSQSELLSKIENLELPLICVIKTTNDSIFGGFTTQKWSDWGSWVKDQKAFIFSLYNSKNPSRVPQRFPCAYPENAFYVNTDGTDDDGFVFSFGDREIEIYADSHDNAKSNCSSLGQFYPVGPGYGSDEAKNFLCGSEFFSTKEIEFFVLT